MKKSLQLQSQMTDELGACVFDVTLDCEDGAIAGEEKDHAQRVAELVAESDPQARVAARVHAVDHPHFEEDLRIIVGQAGAKLRHIMLPKVESLQDVKEAHLVISQLGFKDLALHALIESPLAIEHAFEIASHPSIQSLSFGLMDFVSSHAGAIPSWAMTGEGQFKHPLVVRAKLAMSSACHARGITPSHCVVTEIEDLNALKQWAHEASQSFGYTRMWSIHPHQIRPIIEAFSPSQDEVTKATEIILSAMDANWGPIRFGGHLHDRASYRFFWHVLERAHATGTPLSSDVQSWFVNAQEVLA
jgi:citrate lyase subunit beta/citryl-CoA lyase